MFDRGNAYEPLKESMSEQHSRTWSRTDVSGSGSVGLPHPSSLSPSLKPLEGSVSLQGGGAKRRNLLNDPPTENSSSEVIIGADCDEPSPNRERADDVQKSLSERANYMQRLSIWFCCVKSGRHGCCDYWHLFAAFLALAGAAWWTFRCVTAAMDTHYQDAAEYGGTALISFFCTIYAINQFNNVLSLLLADFGKKLLELKRTERMLDSTRQRFDSLHQKYQVTTEDFVNTQSALEKNVSSLQEAESELKGTQEQLDLNRQQYEITVQRLEDLIKQHAIANLELSSEYDTLNVQHAELNKMYQENIMEQQELINETLMTAMSLQKRGSDEVKKLLGKMGEITKDNSDAALEFGRSFVEAARLKEELERVQAKLEETSECIQESAISLKASADKNLEMGERMEIMIAGISERRGSLDESKKNQSDKFSQLLRKTVSEMQQNLEEWEGARNRFRTFSSITMRDLRSNSVPMRDIRASLENMVDLHRSLPTRDSSRSEPREQKLTLG